MHPVGRIAALESELARVQQEREAEADDLAAMLVRIAETERAKGTAAREALELSELVNALQVQLRDMAARELSDAAQWAKEVDHTRQLLDDTEQRLIESKAMSEALRSWSAETDRKLQAAQQRAAQAEEDLHLAVSRAELAEQSAGEVAASLRYAHAEREADRALVVDLEAKLARVKGEYGEATTALREEHGRTLATLRQEHTAALAEHERRHAVEMAALGKTHEGVVAGLVMTHEGAVAALVKTHDGVVAGLVMTHEGVVASLRKKHDDTLPELEQRHAHTLSAMREEHAAAKRVAARALEEERSVAARAKQQVITLEGSLTSMRGMVARAAELLDELDRREEMAASHRTRTLEQTRQTLAGAACELPAIDPPPAATPHAPHVTPADPGVLDEIEIDLLE